MPVFSRWVHVIVSCMQINHYQSTSIFIVYTVRQYPILHWDTTSKTLLAKSQLTQKNLLKNFGISRGSISRWKNPREIVSNFSWKTFKVKRFIGITEIQCSKDYANSFVFWKYKLAVGCYHAYVVCVVPCTEMTIYTISDLYMNSSLCNRLGYIKEYRIATIHFTKS